MELGRLRLTVGSDGASSVRVANVDPALVFPTAASRLRRSRCRAGSARTSGPTAGCSSRRGEQLAPAMPLVVDAEDGAALESSRGSLFVVREASW